MSLSKTSIFSSIATTETAICSGRQRSIGDTIQHTAA
jgi:hypothetical protein